jgi:hypothetical protein
MRNRRNQRGRRGRRRNLGSTLASSNYTCYTQFQSVAIASGPNVFTYTYAGLTSELSTAARLVRIRSIIVRFYPIGPVANTGPVAVQVFVSDPTTDAPIPCSRIQPLDYYRAVVIRARPNFSASGFYQSNSTENLLSIEVKSPAITTLSWDIEAAFIVARDTLI